MNIWEKSINHLFAVILRENSIKLIIYFLFLNIWENNSNIYLVSDYLRKISFPCQLLVYCLPTVSVCHISRGMEDSDWLPCDNKHDTLRLERWSFENWLKIKIFHASAINNGNWRPWATYIWNFRDFQSNISVRYLWLRVLNFHYFQAPVLNILWENFIVEYSHICG